MESGAAFALEVRTNFLLSLLCTMQHATDLLIAEVWWGNVLVETLTDKQ
jgi:hypothetical protein